MEERIEELERGRKREKKEEERTESSSLKERFSDKIIDKIVRMMEEEEKKERKDNIVIKGLRLMDDVSKDWVQNFLKQSIKVEARILSCRKSGKVIIAKVKIEEKK